MDKQLERVVELVDSKCQAEEKEQELGRHLAEEISLYGVAGQLPEEAWFNKDIVSLGLRQKLRGKCLWVLDTQLESKVVEKKKNNDSPWPIYYPHLFSFSVAGVPATDLLFP